MASTTEKDGSFAALFESAPKTAIRRGYRVGEVLDLEVVRVGKSEVFVALDGKSEGLVPVEELSNEDGKPTVSIGSRVAVRVTGVDRKTGAPELHALSPEPVSPVDAPREQPTQAASVVVGMRVKGKVSGVERFGVFLEFSVAGKPRPERGLVPTGELGVPRGADLRKTFPAGTELEAAVSAIDERGRIRLSVNALKNADERREFEVYAGAAKEKGKEKEKGFGTLGDLLRKK